MDRYFYWRQRWLMEYMYVLMEDYYGKRQLAKTLFASRDNGTDGQASKPRKKPTRNDGKDL